MVRFSKVAIKEGRGLRGPVRGYFSTHIRHLKPVRI
jgi:hypothetical protein